jgi:uncharacterized UPF0160 family protein
MRIVTHSGKFHADDVLAWSLLCHFHPEGHLFRIKRTRDVRIIQEADIVFDVGGIYNPAQGRFDHHQNEYTGPLSSAGMMLQWLTESKWIPSELSSRLNAGLVSYVDDVDNGRVEERSDVPCFSRMINLFNASANTLEEFDQQFIQAANVASGMVKGFEEQFNKEQAAKRLVLEEMTRNREFNNLMEFPEYLSWKSTYYANGGSQHPTEFIMFPSMHGKWQVSAIPPTIESFEQKRSFPIEWAGLRDDELSAITGVPSIFCHKNRFIAVFATRDAALSAMLSFNLLT